MRPTPALAFALIMGAGGVCTVEAGSLSLDERGAPMPSFTLLGDLPGGEFMSRATAVSADGTTVVGYSTSTVLNPNGADEAFRWKDGQMLSLGGGLAMPQSIRYSRATGVNGDGSIVVGNTVFFISPAQTPFKWQNGSLNSAFLEYSTAGGMATNGNWAVSTTWGVGVQGYIVQNGGGNIQVPLLPGGSYSQFGVSVQRISSDGSAVIGWSNSAGNINQAIRYKIGSGTTALGFLPGCTSNEATAISADGNLVLGRCNGPGGIQRFRWTPDDGIQPSNIILPVIAMSDDASVMIGESGIWDAVNGVRNLKTVAASWGLNMSGIFDLTGTDISADGRVIVGYALKNDLSTEAFRLVSPEPAAAMLLAPVLLLLRRPRRRRKFTTVATPSRSI